MIDLRSDTVTQPTDDMKAAMMAAPLGDDVLGDDPSVKQLEEKIAAISGKDTAIFVPSGTMANQIAIWLHTRRGDSVGVEKNAHIFHYEAAAPAIFSSVMLRPIEGEAGIMNISSLEEKFLPPDPHFAPMTLVCAEDTANRGGGQYYRTQQLHQLCETIHNHKASAHLDGARAFNAAVASGDPLNVRVSGFDTVSICFSKGLGAPVGSALCLPAELRDRAIRARKAMGGGMRQSGMMAAAANYALDRHIERLHEDHLNAQQLAEGLKTMGLDVEPCYTNMVYFHHPKAPELIEKVRAKGVLALALTPTRIRMVTHLQVSITDIARTIDAIHSTVSELESE